MTDSTSPDATPAPRTEHRIFVEWADGSYLSSLSSDFGAELQRFVARSGAPTLVEYRADGEGWIRSPPVLALCPACIDKIGGANPGPEAAWVPCEDGEPCEAADCDNDGARFGVCWDNGPATGEFGDYASREEAKAAGEDWRLTMIGEDDNYDLAHFEFIMRGLKEVADQQPEVSDYLSLSLHCETAEIMNAYTKMVEDEGNLAGLAAYSAARPPHSEGLAIFIASYLSHETECANINLLHLSSRKAMEAALMMQEVFPHINFRREVTVGHLLLDIEAPAGVYAKVNPPIRPREDVEYLWQTVLDGKVDWIVSDHACCSAEQKVDSQKSDNVFLAKAGFGGTEYLLSGVFSEGSKRGMPYNQMAQLLCWNPSRRYGLLAKGDIAVGYDADLVLLDPDESFQVHSSESPSSQGYTPFEGLELTGRVKSTYLRGKLICQNGEVVGDPQGRYLKRPYALET